MKFEIRDSRFEIGEVRSEKGLPLTIETHQLEVVA